MGIVSSVFCSVLFCIERVATWTFCAILLLGLMFMLLVLMVYGISVGYHYAQKELAAFALESRKTTTPKSNGTNSTTPKILRMHFETTTEKIELEVFGTLKPTETTENTVETIDPSDLVLELERPTIDPEAKRKVHRLIHRQRRARNATMPKLNYIYYMTEQPFLRPLRFRHAANVTRHFVT